MAKQSLLLRTIAVQGGYISGCTRPIIAIFSPRESDLRAADRSRDAAMATNFVQKWQSAQSSLWHSETAWDNAIYMHY